MQTKIESLRTPDERFAVLPYFPYEPHYVDPLPGFGDLRMHYVDEGPKDAGDVSPGGRIFRRRRLDFLSFHCMPHPMRKKDACGANATAQIKRSDFNMGKHVPHVSDEVVLSIPIEAIKL